MKLFIPNIDNQDDFYKRFVENLKKSGYQISNRKIYSISYFEGTEKKICRVGEEAFFSKQMENVYLILYDELRSMYIVCTAKNGIYAGNPFTIGKRNIYMIKEILFND